MDRKSVLRAGRRQRQVLALVARGKKDAAIASELGLSVATVRTYLTRLYRDNGLSNRAEAVAAWSTNAAPPSDVPRDGESPNTA